MKKIILIIFGISTCLSCNYMFYPTPTFVKKGFTLCYDENDTKIDSLINIDGYYQEIMIRTREENQPLSKDIRMTIDTNRINVIFFKDGICVIGFSSARHDINISSYFKKIIHNDSLGIKTDFYEDFYWGKYILLNDTIILQCFSKPFLFTTSATWYGDEYQYKIIDRNTIKQIYQKPICRKDKMKYYESFIKGKTYYPAKFIPNRSTAIFKRMDKKEKVVLV